MTVLLVSRSAVFRARLRGARFGDDTEWRSLGAGFRTDSVRANQAIPPEKADY